LLLPCLFSLQSRWLLLGVPAATGLMPFPPQPCDKALQIFPEDSDYYLYRGSAFEELGNFQAANIDYSKAIQFAPDEGIYYYFRGCIYEKQGDLDAAITDYSKAIQFSKIYSHHHTIALFFFSRGIARKAQGDIHNADIDFSEVIRLEPDNSDYLYILENIQKKQNGLENASPNLEESFRNKEKKKYIEDHQGMMEEISNIVRI